MSAGINFMKHASSILRNRAPFIHGLQEVYKPALNRNREKLIELIRGGFFRDLIKREISKKAEQASKSELARKMRVAKEFYASELSPPGKNEMKQLLMSLAVAKEFIKIGCHKDMTVKQAWLMFLVGLEVSMWFFLGETIGKMHIVGYDV